jgi:hypothetical protein
MTGGLGLRSWSDHSGSHRSFLLRLQQTRRRYHCRSLVRPKVHAIRHCIHVHYCSPSTRLFPNRELVLFTIGYGDYTPSNTAGKVLVFPFAILTISQLGNEISLIVSFIRERSRERRRVWREKYEGAIHREAELLKPNATLVEEMRLVHEINKREEW